MFDCEGIDQGLGGGEGHAPGGVWYVGITGEARGFVSATAAESDDIRAADPGGADVLLFQREFAGRAIQ